MHLHHIHSAYAALRNTLAPRIVGQVKPSSVASRKVQKRTSKLGVHQVCPERIHLTSTTHESGSPSCSHASSYGQLVFGNLGLPKQTHTSMHLNPKDLSGSLAASSQPRRVDDYFAHQSTPPLRSHRRKALANETACLQTKAMAACQQTPVTPRSVLATARSSSAASQTWRSPIALLLPPRPRPSAQPPGSL